MCWNFNFKTSESKSSKWIFQLSTWWRIRLFGNSFFKNFQKYRWRGAVDVLHFWRIDGPLSPEFFCRFWPSVDRQQLRKNSLQSEKTLTSMRPFKKLFSLNYIKSIWIWRCERHLRTHVINSRTIDRRKKLNQVIGSGVEGPRKPMSRQGEIGQFHGGGLPCGGSGAGTNPDLHYTHGLQDSVPMKYSQLRSRKWFNFSSNPIISLNFKFKVSCLMNWLAYSIFVFFKNFIWSTFFKNGRQWTNIGRNADHSEVDAAGGVSSGHLHSSASHGNGTNTSSELSNIRL